MVTYPDWRRSFLVRQPVAMLMERSDFSAASVDRHHPRIETEPGDEVACVREDEEGNQAGERGQCSGCHVGVRDARGGVRAADAPVALAAIVEKTAIPIVPPISWPVELRPEIIPDSSAREPVMTEIETETTAIPRPKPATSIPGRMLRR